MSTSIEAFQNFSNFINRLVEDDDPPQELSFSLVIICPDCGKNFAYRYRCPTCGGESWMPAGAAGSVFQQLRAQQWRDGSVDRRRDVSAPELVESVETEAMTVQ